MTLMATSAAADELAFDQTFQQESGVVFTYPNVNKHIDPYFPTKSILTAMDAGMATGKVANEWIGWLIHKQEVNGLFSRFCAEGDGHKACRVADADDSMMAMWVELLYRTAPKDGLPAHWRESADLAEKQLEELFDEDMNVYVISKQLPVGLLMDNVEIHSALKQAGAAARRQGELERSGRLYAKAAKLRQGIIQTFWDEDKDRYRITTQKRNANEFYPDIVAQLTPVLHNFKHSRTNDLGKVYDAWMRDHKEQWMGMIGNNFPWGLVAVSATQQDDMDTANCWYQATLPYRNKLYWNVLDDAALQTVEYELRKEWPEGLPDCKGAVSS